MNPELGYVTTSAGARRSITGSASRIATKNILAGRQMLDNELEHLGISLKEAEKLLIPRYNMNSLDEVLAAIGGGHSPEPDGELQGKFNKPSAEEQDREALRQLVRRKRRRRLVTRTTAEWWWAWQSDAHIARCCQPIPGDDIVGFITGARYFDPPCGLRSAGRSAIARAGRIVDAVWGESYPAVIRWWCA